jgi:hypothetical protein
MYLGPFILIEENIGKGIYFFSSKKEKKSPRGAGYIVFISRSKFHKS